MSNSQSKPTVPEIAQPRPITSIYVEGITQMSIGFPNSRLLMHSFTEKKAVDGQEIRHIACELIMPTAGIVELAQNLINQLAQHKESIINTGRAYANTYDNIFKSLETINILRKPDANNDEHID
jgi:hypothetical protein